MTGTNASIQADGVTGPALSAKFATAPSPIVKPSVTRSTSTSTFKPASTFCTRRPGPMPMMCTTVSAPIAVKAMAFWGETERVTSPSGS